MSKGEPKRPTLGPYRENATPRPRISVLCRIGLHAWQWTERRAGLWDTWCPGCNRWRDMGDPRSYA